MKVVFWILGAVLVLVAIDNRLQLGSERSKRIELEAETNRIQMTSYYRGLEERSRLMNESFWGDIEAAGGYVRRNKDGGATIWIVPSEADSARRVDSLLAVPPKDRQLDIDTTIIYDSSEVTE